MADEFRGKIGTMDSQEVAAFLGSDALARLACVRPDGSPYVIPVWFHWDGEDFWFVGRKKAEWCRYLEQDPRVCIVIDAPHSPADEMGKSTEVPKVFAEGTVEVVEQPNIGGRWVEIAEQMSYRYLGPNGPTYLTASKQQPRWLFRMRPTRIKTWQGVGWAPKYWVDESGGPSYEQIHS